MDISGKVTIITGASAGIGLATARLFADEGAKVVLAARSADKLTALAEELRSQGREALPAPTDMRNKASVDRMVELTFRHYGQIDILINNAGQAAAGTVAEVSEDDFRQIIDLNVLGCVYAIQAVVPGMRQGEGGLIINISSMVSKMHIPGLGAYAATKTALNMLSETARVELAPDNIRVITFYPRSTSTDFGKHSLGDLELRRRQRDSVASRGIAVDTPEQVAEKILYAALNEPAEQYMDR
jgi:NADP-dependent 3-hydroxy acid dehydrogenase YdfG